MRYTIELSEAGHQKLVEVARTHKLKQGDVLEVLLDTMTPAQVTALEERGSRRKSPRALANQLLSKYSAEELEALLHAKENV